MTARTHQAIRAAIRADQATHAPNTLAFALTLVGFGALSCAGAGVASAAALGATYGVGALGLSFVAEEVLP